MGMKQTEVLKLALEVLEAGHSTVYGTSQAARAITAIREALAEQTALLAANKDLQNHFDALMNDYKKLSALCSSQGTRLMEYESSHEPESKPWVGLSTSDLDEIDAPIRERGSATIAEIYRAIEAKLREKNA